MVPPVIDKFNVYIIELFKERFIKHFEDFQVNIYVLQDKWTAFGKNC
jgi:hypothetical protein